MRRKDPGTSVGTFGGGGWEETHHPPTLDGMTSLCVSALFVVLSRRKFVFGWLRCGVYVGVSFGLF
jgi:hypothetical protein